MPDFCSRAMQQHGGLDKLTRTQSGLSALPTCECEHPGKAGEQIHRSAMRAHFARNPKS